MKMKFVKAIFFLAIMMITVSCKDALEEQYRNPEQTENASIGKFFTKMLDNDRVRPSYWNVRTFLVMQPALYTQAVSFENSNRRYQQQLSYIDDYWRDYYTPTGSGIVAHYREMQKLYSTLSSDEKAKADVFMHAARVIYADQTAQVVDLWGDIPYSQAGGLNLNGTATPPPFDHAADIYATMLTDLESAAEFFSSATLESTAAAAFTKQDILMKGNIGKWERYANSLRLRLLMRISFQNESKAQTDVLEMLNNPDKYPLVDDASFNVLLDALTTYNDNMRNALTEVTSHIAPEYLLDEVLKPANDPRIRALFDKNTSGGVHNADYFSMPANISSSEQETNISAGKYAILDSATFLFNKAFPGIVFTSAETNFLKAEALQRWGNSTDAQAAYEKGVTDAVNFVFYLNTLGLGHEAPPTPSEMSDLLANPSVEYAGTQDELLAKIWMQKWISFGFMQSNQGWAEMRRTKVPVLTFVPDGSTPASSLPPSRLFYPTSEKTYNATNYAAVSAADVANGKIFWDVK